MITEDIIKTVFNADSGPLQRAFQQLEQRAASFQQKMGQVENLSRLNSKLKDTGLTMNKIGGIQDRVTGKLVSQEEAMRRITEQSKMQKRLAADRKAYLSGPAGMEDLQKFSGTGRQLGMMANQGVNVDKQITEMQNKLKNNKQHLDAFNKSLKESRHRFNMNTLSWMFGGMALQRVGLMMTRFLIPSMDKLEKLNTEGSKKVMGMTAAFEFLKISIFETLSNTPMFKAFVEWVIKAALWVSEFAQKHPDITAIAAAIAGIATVLGTLAIGTGIFMQLEHLGKLLGSEGLLAKITKVDDKFGLLKKTIGAGLIISAGLRLYDALTNEETSSWGSVLITAIQAGLGAALLFNPATGIITGLVIAAVMTIDKLKDDEIARRANESKIKIQQIFNNLGDLDLSLDFESFNDLFSSALRYTGSKELEQSAQRLREDLNLKIIDEDTFRTRMANLFGTVRTDIGENNPFIGIADLTKEDYGFDSFELMWFGIMDDQLTAATKNNALIQESMTNMATLSGESIRKEIITPLDSWVPAEKTVTIRANYVGFDHDKGGRPESDFIYGALNTADEGTNAMSGGR